MATQFLIIPYMLGKRNKMEPLPAQSSRTEGLALRTAERMADRMHGVVVLKQDYDETADFADEPVVLAVHGIVPASWDEAKRAA